MGVSRQIYQLVGVAFAGVLATVAPAQSGDVTVFAAASLKEALDAVTERFEVRTNLDVNVSYAASSTLARQIERGAPADIYISASVDWMAHLQASGHIAEGTRVDLLGNSLVLIGPAPQPEVIKITSHSDLTALLDGGRLAMALTKSVPAGIYGKSALETLGLWEGVAPAVAETDNVRAAMTLVALRAAPLGIVYATDALAEPRVALFGTFPAETHPPIIYPAGLTAGTTSDEATSFLDYLNSTDADGIFEAHGFSVLVE